MKIGEVATATGTNTKTIRYYEEIGLLAAPERSANGYRSYAPEAIERIDFIRDAQAAGLSLAEIGSVLEERDRGHSTCEHVSQLLDQHLDELDQRIRSMQRMRDKLSDMAQRAHSLDPADCTDPIRCQTITSNDGPGATIRPIEPHHSHI